jgi:hypothetical protein
MFALVEQWQIAAPVRLERFINTRDLRVRVPEPRVAAAGQADRRA